MPVSPRAIPTLARDGLVTEEIFADSFRRDYSATTRFLRSRGIAEELAEELAQAAWTRGWERRDQVRDPSALGAWVNSIAFNMLRSHVKGSKRFVELAEGEAAALDALAQLDVVSLLRGCSELDRRLMTAFYLEGYTAQEISRRLGLTASAIRVRLMRARQKLRARISSGGP